MRAALPTSMLAGIGRSTIVMGAILGLTIACLAVLFTDGLVFISHWWRQDEYSHGWLIPPISAYIIWQRWPRIVESREEGSWWGFLLVLAALGIFLIGEAALFQRLSPFAFVIGLMGLALAWLGWSAMRYLWAPLGFLFFAMPLPGSLYVPLSVELQFISSEIGAAILQLLGISVFLDGNIIDLGAFKLQVAEACSGLRYLFPLMAFGFLCAWIYRGPVWAKAIILLAVAPITILTNSARIALTGMFLEYGSAELAEGFMHLFEGWIIFIVALFILFALMWFLARIAGIKGGLVDLLDFDRMAGTHIEPPVRRSVARMPATAAIAALVLLCTAIPAKAAVADREQFIPARPGLVTFPLELEGGWRGVPSSLSRDLLAAVGADDYLLSDFVRSGESGSVNMWVAYYDEQIRDSAIHSPRDCLPGGGWEYVTLETIDSPVAAAGGERFQINRGLIAKGQEQMIIYYWLDMRGRRLTDDFTLKFYNLWDSLTTGRSDGALVRLITPVHVNESEASADARLQDFMTATYPLLQPHIGH